MTDDETDTDDEQVAESAWDDTDEKDGSKEPDSDAGMKEDIDWAEIEDRSGIATRDDESVPAPADEGGQSAPEAAEQPPAAEDALKDTEEPFEEMDTDSVGADEVWADVADEEGSEEAVAEMEIADEEGSEEASDEEAAEAADIAEVSKHAYCETCEHFSRAPEIHCMHEGTEILDFTDMGSVRVANCPIVAEREGLEEGVAKGSTDLGDVRRE